MATPKKKRKPPEPTWQKVAKKTGRVVGVVIHDPKVKRAAWQFAILIAVRLLIAAGASAQLVELIQHLS